MDKIRYSEFDTAIRIVVVVMILILAILIGSGAVKHSITCPIDGQTATYTGQQRQVKGITECQYEHIYFRYNGAGFLIEEPHVFWEDCNAN
jgi:5-bromo-4-chloroindolyl phosphate hydrolysis protein